jgi:hypothetical protein
MLMDEYGDENSQPLGAWVREADTGVTGVESVEWSQWSGVSGVDKIQYSIAGSFRQSSIRTTFMYCSHKSKVKRPKGPKKAN